MHWTNRRGRSRVGITSEKSMSRSISGLCRTTRIFLECSMPLQTPGSWLYRRDMLSWLSDPALVRQLPWVYRLFARYCDGPGYQPMGAELLLRAIIALGPRKSSLDGIIPLQIGGVTVFLDLLDPRFLRIPLELTEAPRVLRHFLRPGDTFIDAGANHGTFSMIAARLVGAEGLVVSIEPQPRLAGILRKLATQSLSRFQVHEIACGQRSAEIEFYIPSATSGSGGLFRQFSGQSRHRTIQVAMRPLDDVIDWRRLPGRILLKLDLEGSELSCLAGAGRLLRATVPVLMLEINPAAMQAAAASKPALLKTLFDLGYRRFVTPVELEFPRPLTNEVPDGDIIVLPETAQLR
jgi:FkbM family methyltransferase